MANFLPAVAAVSKVSFFLDDFTLNLFKLDNIYVNVSNQTRDMVHLVLKTVYVVMYCVNLFFGIRFMGSFSLRYIVPIIISGPFLVVASALFLTTISLHFLFLNSKGDCLWPFFASVARVGVDYGYMCWSRIRPIKLEWLREWSVEQFESLEELHALRYKKMWHDLSKKERREASLQDGVEEALRYNSHDKMVLRYDRGHLQYC